jgi:hypothetical protein
MVRYLRKGNWAPAVRIPGPSKTKECCSGQFEVESGCEDWILKFDGKRCAGRGIPPEGMQPHGGYLRRLLEEFQLLLPEEKPWRPAPVYDATNACNPVGDGRTSV